MIALNSIEILRYNFPREYMGSYMNWGARHSLQSCTASLKSQQKTYDLLSFTIFQYHFSEKFSCNFKNFSVNFHVLLLLLLIFSKDTGSTKAKPVRGAPWLVTYIYTHRYKTTLTNKSTTTNSYTTNYNNYNKD